MRGNAGSPHDAVAQDPTLYVAEPLRQEAVPVLRARSLFSARMRPINDGESIAHASEFMSNVGKIIDLKNEGGDPVVNGKARCEHFWEEDGWIMMRLMVL